jgi:hypothetical protein
MQFIHSREYLDEGESFEVMCDTKSNVMLTTDSDFARFKERNSFNFFGGFYEKFPIRLFAKHSGYWNLTIDVGEGYEANIRYTINVIRVGK